MVSHADDNPEPIGAVTSGLRLSRLNYADDPLLDGDDEPEDSWCVSVLSWRS